MSISKFERRKIDLQKKFEEEMRAVQVAEQKEIEKRVDPIVSKFGKVAEEEVRKALEADPELLEFFSFKKRDVAKALREAIIEIFAADKPAEHSGEDKTQDQKKTEVEVKTETPKDPFSDDFERNGSAT